MLFGFYEENRRGNIHESARKDIESIERNLEIEMAEMNKQHEERMKTIDNICTTLTKKNMTQNELNNAIASIESLKKMYSNM